MVQRSPSFAISHNAEIGSVLQARSECGIDNEIRTGVNYMAS